MSFARWDELEANLKLSSPAGPVQVSHNVLLSVLVWDISSSSFLLDTSGPLLSNDFDYNGRIRTGTVLITGVRI